MSDAPDDKYLFLLRWNGKLPDNPISAGAKLKKLLSGIIRGDSLDTPFINFIPVQSISHTIGDIADEKEHKDLQAAHDWKQWSDYGNLSSEAADSVTAHRRSASKKLIANQDWQWSGEKPMLEPGALRGSLPQQKHLSFTKRLDSATPQLAYGCSTQEQFKVALFYFRRKIGFNVAAIPFPYLVIGLEDVVIREWKLDDNSETVTLSYNRICWGGVSQWADTPAPQGISTRIFDRTTGSGGMVDVSSDLTKFLVVLTGVMYTAAWATVGGVTGQGVQ